MKDAFLEICVGCFVIPMFLIITGIIEGICEFQLSEYTKGFFACMSWRIVVDGLKEMGWLK